MRAAASDRLREGLVASLARPGGHVTGVSRAPDSGLGGKRIELPPRAGQVIE